MLSHNLKHFPLRIFLIAYKIFQVEDEINKVGEMSDQRSIFDEQVSERRFWPMQTRIGDKTPDFLCVVTLQNFR